MLTSEEIEVALLSSIKDSTDLTWLMREGVVEDMFLVYGAVWDYFLLYSRKYEGQIPKARDVKAKFREEGEETFEFVEPGELAYYAEELRQQYVVRATQASILKRLGEGGLDIQEEPDETVRLLIEDLQNLQPKAVQNVSFLDRDALQRMGWYQERVEARKKGLVMGIPTGFPVFDDALQGWGPGEVTMIMGPKGVGKSWFALFFACVAYKAGYRVLFISPEMHWQQISLRFDVLLGRMVGVELSHTAIKTGRLKEEGEYQSWLERLTQSDRFVCVSANYRTGAFTLEGILAAQDQYKPDLMIIDGIHLIGDNNERRQGWEIIKRAADGIKSAALYHNKSVIWVCQVDREAIRNNTEPATSAASASYGAKAAAEAADRLITLGNYAGDAQRKVFRVPYNRDGSLVDIKQHVLFDVDYGRIEQISGTLSDDFNPDGEIDIRT